MLHSLIDLLCTGRKLYQYLYVHSKLMIVDDACVTIGSANLVDLSLNKDHTEMNASCWDRYITLLLLREWIDNLMSIAL